MKIVLAGGGSGGHFYPLIAVAQEVNDLIKEEKLVGARLYYLSNSPYDPHSLFENQIEYHYVPAGKKRRYFSVLNFFDNFKIVLGVLVAIWKLYFIYPDVVFSKGGYASFPILFAARFLKIPVVIHESDSDPGRVNLWSAKFAVRIAVAYPEAMEFFPADRAALVGHPIRRELKFPISNGAHEFLHLSRETPVIFVTGGSQGAQMINDTLLDILPQLVERYQIIHQVGKANTKDVEQRAKIVLENSQFKDRYKLFPFLNTSAVQMIAGIADLIVSRGGAGSLFEIAHWGIPSIIIPIPEPISHDQRKNAFAYARSGGAAVIEQNNLTASVLLSEIKRLMDNPGLREVMKRGAKTFARPDAGRLIADEIIKIALQHEQ